ncbi:MAG: GNAT family N-acetyltransferase [Waltera sp.]
MMETLSRGLGEVLYAEGKNVLIYLPEIGNAMLNAEDEEHLEKMLPLIPKAVSGHSIVTVTDRWNERVSEILGYHGSMLCSQACYTRGEPLPVRHKDIRQLTVEEVPYVAEHYHLGDEIYVRERITAGDVFGIYIEGKLCGFIGCHNDGSMGMLYVEDAYRRQGLAASLEGYLINKQREQGMIPYAHIVNGNEASIQLQERLGLNLSDPVIWWLYN